MKKILFIIAFLILSNPIISSVDYFPDFIGCILIMIALFKPSYYSEKADGAYKCAKNLLIISVLRLICALISIKLVDPIVPLLFSFTFAVLEIIFGISLILKLFEYFNEGALKADNSVALKILDTFKILLIVIWVIKLVLSTLPDFILLTIGDPLSFYNNDLSEFRPHLIVIAYLISRILATPWRALTVSLCFITLTRKERRVSKAIFKERVKHRGFKYSYRVHQIVFALLMVLSFNAYELKIDGKNIFFLPILPLFFIFAYLFLLICKGKFDKMYFAFLGTAIVQLIFTVVTRILTKLYFKEYTLESVLKISQAETKYFTILPFYLISALLFTLSVAIMLHLIIKDGKNALVSYSPSILSGADIEYTVSDYKKRMTRLGIITCAVSLANSLFSGVVYAFKPQIDDLTKVKIFALELNLPLFPSLIPIQFILTTAFIVTFIIFVVKSNDLTYKKLNYSASLD